MNGTDARYTRFALCREMLDTVGVVDRFDPTATAEAAATIAEVGRLFLTGEGSSRIFPAKNAIRKAMAWGADLWVATDGSRQAATYELSKFAVFGASNSGRTAEVIAVLQRLANVGNPHRFGLTANEGTLLEQHAATTFILTCGWEQAVAATKSVVEQALVYQSIVSHVAGRDMVADLEGAAGSIEAAMKMSIDPGIVRTIVDAPTVYFAGYNDGVAEELTLKTNEIARKKSDFLEGTYAVHGIEEVMDPRDVVVVIDPIADEEAKFETVLVDGVGLTVVAISPGDTRFPTIRVPDAGEMNPFVFLAAGWNLLVEIGLALEIDLDKPERARKVGNEFGS
ncbi:MAG: sugar isomerase [Gemmatimonadetes bacterium]|nr:sugar isomerase [Gemmatimonadota bacterium]NNF37207.1 sugar isomerase [Gemmatimonadota bacterium]